MTDTKVNPSGAGADPGVPHLDEISLTEGELTKRLEGVVVRLMNWCDCGGEGCDLCHAAKAVTSAAISIVTLQQQSAARLVPEEPSAVYRIEVDREADGRWFATWSSGNSSGSGRYAATPLGALKDLYDVLVWAQDVNDESRSPDGDGHVAVRETTGKPRTPATVEHRSVGEATTPPQVPQRQRTEAGCAGSIPVSSSTAGSIPADSQSKADLAPVDDRRGAREMQLRRLYGERVYGNAEGGAPAIRGRDVYLASDVDALLRRCGAICRCKCCDHSEASDCGCDCHAEGACSFQVAAARAGGRAEEQTDEQARREAVERGARGGSPSPTTHERVLTEAEAGSTGDGRARVDDVGRDSRAHQSGGGLQIPANASEVAPGDGRADLFDAEAALRQEWWAGHGCPVAALYGDDGEMQCNAASCMRDFKREPLDVLAQHVHARRLARLVIPEAGDGRAMPEDVDVQLLAWAVSNCHTLARRRLNAQSSDAEWWQHVQRICEKAGARSQGVLRASVPTEITDGAAAARLVGSPEEPKQIQATQTWNEDGNDRYCESCEGPNGEHHPDCANKVAPGDRLVGSPEEDHENAGCHAAASGLVDRDRALSLDTSRAAEVAPGDGRAMKEESKHVDLRDDAGRADGAQSVGSELSVQLLAANNGDPEVGSLEPIALRDEKGTVRAWACPRCYRVSMPMSCGGPYGRDLETKASREQALQCGICQGCGIVLPCDRFERLCAACRQKEQARFEEVTEQHREEWAREAAERRESREKYLDRLLADVPALLKRDWSDDEETAVELLPLVLQRLAAEVAAGDARATQEMDKFNEILSEMLCAHGTDSPHCDPTEDEPPCSDCQKLFRRLREAARVDECKHYREAGDGRAESIRFVDPNTEEGQQAIRNAQFLRPTTQGDPPPDSPEDLEAHPWKAGDGRAARLQALIAKWRENSEALYRASRSTQESVAAEACMVEGAGTLSMCADELETELALTLGGQPEGQ